MVRGGLSDHLGRLTAGEIRLNYDRPSPAVAFKAMLRWNVIQAGVAKLGQRRCVQIAVLSGSQVQILPSAS